MRHPHGDAGITKELGNIYALLKRQFAARYLAEMLRLHIQKTAGRKRWVKMELVSAKSI